MRRLRLFMISFQPEPLFEYVGANHPAFAPGRSWCGAEVGVDSALVLFHRASKTFQAGFFFRVQMTDSHSLQLLSDLLSAHRLILR